ncbi:hypothetical protein B9T34_02245 [Acinetobacter sp. ANC 3813]|nr:hypothetical protein B9T34_02245 [Acinetobacter sp. ANC 3813]
MPDSKLGNYDQTIYLILNWLFLKFFQASNRIDQQCLHVSDISLFHCCVMGTLSCPHLNNAGISVSDLTEYLVIIRQSLNNALKMIRA